MPCVIAKTTFKQMERGVRDARRSSLTYCRTYLHEGMARRVLHEINAWRTVEQGLTAIRH
jgi:hypothetical protein